MLAGGDVGGAQLLNADAGLHGDQALDHLLDAHFHSEDGDAAVSARDI